MTISKLATHTNMSQHDVVAVEEGDFRIRPSALLDFSEALGTTVSFFFEDRMDRPELVTYLASSEQKGNETPDEDTAALEVADMLLAFSRLKRSSQRQNILLLLSQLERVAGGIISEDR